jgi:pullulanase
VLTFGQIDNDFSTYPIYEGNDLGLTYTPTHSIFKIWSPVAEKATLLFYKESSGGQILQRFDMNSSAKGTWEVKIPGNQKGNYYCFKVLINGKWSKEVPDPYVKAVGTNGKRGIVIDENESNPEKWENDKSPAFKNSIDAIIYELHVRDASIAANSGIKNKGKFIGLTEKDTHTISGMFTGLDHFKELGVTHIHLLPVFDFFSVDESKPDSSQYNWGYDPLNYNVPEGSYSTNPDDGVTRIKEFKALINALHNNGLRVVMDVVYNHTMFTENSWFNELVPGYYYRQAADGKFSNGSACGNETASERPMMRKFIIESLEYWVKKYHVDGFRFDLMGLHDIETMNLISQRLKKLKPSILLYGEGWTAGKTPIPENLLALKKNVSSLKNIAVFGDDFRDGIKGSVFNADDRGFVSGKKEMEESIKFGIVAATKHPQINYSKINYSKTSYTTNPAQVISYCECHDNNVLWDKLKLSCPNNTELERKEMHKLALTIVLTAQGIPFLHAGTEFLRSKKGVENSFNAGDSINAIDWDLKAIHKDVFLYVKDLINMRKKHPAFRMHTSASIAQNIHFISSSSNLVSFTINGKKMGDSWKNIFVVFNGSEKSRNLDLPGGNWKPFILNNQQSFNKSSSLKIEGYSAAIFYQD